MTMNRQVNTQPSQARVTETPGETVRWIKVKIIDDTPGDELWIEELVDEEEE